jgi:uncharacterized protein involved in exopolysaccharide biosynthesis
MSSWIGGAEPDGLEGGGVVNPLEILRDPVGVLRRRWRWMLLALLVGFLAVGVFAYVWEPRYVAIATVQVASQPIPVEFVRTTVSEDSIDRINVMVGAMVSQKTLSKLVEEFDLYPRLRERLPMVEILMRIRTGISFAEGRPSGKGARSRSARLYEISYQSSDPKVAAGVANALASTFVTTGVQMRSQRAETTTAFLRKELERGEKALREQNQEIREFKELYRGELPDELEANLRHLERLQLQRQSLAMRIADAETRLALLVSDERSPDARLAALRAALAEEVAVHTERHPNVISLRSQIAALEQEMTASKVGQVGSSHSAMVDAATRAVSQMRKELANTEAEIESVDARVARTPARQLEIGALEQRASVLRENYIEFLNKVQEAELAENLELAQQGERITVGAFLFSIGVGLLFELLDPVVLSARQVESVSGMPVLGSVPRVS